MYLKKGFRKYRSFKRAVAFHSVVCHRVRSPRWCLPLARELALHPQQGADTPAGCFTGSRARARNISLPSSY